jgi:pyruvate/2-oxoglutarate dehydrogenase complex dihydrolipoamide dehydrogenase (E3) component
VNFGCSPTKAAIASAKVAFQARRASEFGVEIPEVRVDFPAVLRRARGVAETKRAGLDRGLEGSENPVLIRGHARLEGREDAGFRVTVGERTLLVGQVVLNTGTRTLIPPIEDLETVDFIDSGNWMDREELPGHLAVVGGSYIGLEMAQFYRRMGSDVTVVVGSSDHVTSAEDDDVSEAMRGILAEEGVRFVFCERARRVAADGDGITLALDGEDPAEVRATHLFLATGRRPNTDDLGLENVGLEADGGALSRPTSGCRRTWRASGPAGTSGAGTCSPTPPTTTTACSSPRWPATAGAPPTAWCRTGSSPTPSSAAWA